ncbi:MAG TPA: hypothetical protein VMW06_06910 [Desulfobacterales bacterium]|nr:hypothetical protein [Desulfobacterales bacterium]
MGKNKNAQKNVHECTKFRACFGTHGRIYTMKNSFFAAISPPIRRFSAG